MPGKKIRGSILVECIVASTVFMLILISSLHILTSVIPHIRSQDVNTLMADDIVREIMSDFAKVRNIMEEQIRGNDPRIIDMKASYGDYQEFSGLKEVTLVLYIPGENKPRTYRKLFIYEEDFIGNDQ